jgi:hypothetical protein
MNCKGCHSDKPSVFNGEIAIHFPGLEGLNKSIVWVFPKLVVCLRCGFAEFAVPERELEVLEKGSPVVGAVVLTEYCRPSEEVRIKAPSHGMNDWVFRADCFECAAADPALKASQWIRTKNIETM